MTYRTPEQTLASRQDHWALQYREAVEQGYEGTEEEFFGEQNKHQESMRHNGVDAGSRPISKYTDENNNTTSTKPNFNTPIKSTTSTRLDDLADQITQLAKRVDTLSQESMAQQGDFLMLLGSTLTKQGHGIRDAAMPPTTSALMVPQEEDINDHTVKVIMDGDGLTIYRTVEGTLVPFVDNKVDKQTIIDKLTSFNVASGVMTTMNIYLLRG
jgi:hypothetical protein